MYAPPCTHTSTGNPPPALLAVPAAAPGAAVQTLSVSQFPSSAADPCVAGAAGNCACGATGPNRVASRTPSQEAAGRGAANLRSPTGGLAYGMPRKTATPLAPA